MDDPFAAETLALSISEIARKGPLVVVCVGTDRSTGDSLGPLIGTELLATLNSELTIYGCLEEPVHALNLDDYVNKININHSDSVVLAIDACLGKTDNIGYIVLKQGALKPGTGVNKTLPEIGDYHITGTVNVGGLMEYFVLQNTRLSLVMRMSGIISKSILLSARAINVNRA